MAIEIECTHCHVLMTSWAAPGSPVRYWQCPFCGRTHSSLYSEVFDRAAGARRVEPGAVGGAPAAQPSPTNVPWTALKARAARWFERLEQQQRPVASGDGALTATARPAAGPASR